MRITPIVIFLSSLALVACSSEESGEDSPADVIQDQDSDNEGGGVPDMVGSEGGTDTSSEDIATADDTVVPEDVGAGLCQNHEECDDGIDCTEDVCTIEGICTNDLVDGLCYIEESCIPAGQLNAENECQICDPTLSNTQWTPRQDVPCDDDNPCTEESFCNKEVCEGTPVPSCCGNGIVEDGELCDGDCVEECVPSTACAEASLMGSPENCDVQCVEALFTECVDDDGCCPGKCTNAQDNDCLDTCGNGVVDANETCDGNCPTECPVTGQCLQGILTGSSETCDAACISGPITDCIDDDGCCAKGCTEAEDSDCQPTCGNGIVEPGETCDGNCPTACFSSSFCSELLLEGSPETCDAQCVAGEPPGCVSGDGCCPIGCNPGLDSDCSETECELLINVECGEGPTGQSTYRIQALDPAYGPDGLAPHGHLYYSAYWPDQELLVNFCLNDTGKIALNSKNGCIHATYEIDTCVPLDYPKACQKTQCFECP